MQTRYGFFLIIILGFCALLWLVKAHGASSNQLTTQTRWVAFQLPIAPEFGNITTSDGRIIWAYDGNDIIYIFDLRTHQVEEYMVSDEETCPEIVWNDSRWSFDWPWLVMPADCSQVYNGLLNDSLLAINLETGVDKLIPLPAGEPTPDNVDYPRLHEGQVVWRAGDTQPGMGLWIDPATHRLYLSDVETGASIVLADEPPPQSEAIGSVAGEWTAWDTVHLDNFEHTVHVYNTVTSEHVTIPIDDYLPFPFPQFNGKWVYWPVNDEVRNTQEDDTSQLVGWQGFHLEEQEIVTLVDLNAIDPSLRSCILFDIYVTCRNDGKIYVYDSGTQELEIIFDKEGSVLRELFAKDDVIVWWMVGSSKALLDPLYYVAIKVSHYIHLPVVHGP